MKYAAMRHYHAYIDEAGDEGFGKLRDLTTRGGQSTWLVLGSIVVREANDQLLPHWRDELRIQFPEKKKPDLHWANLNHDQKRVVCAGLAAQPLGVALTLSHKVTLPGSKYEHLFKKPQYLYNYLVRWLLERLITACQNNASPDTAKLHLTFSRRGGTDYQVMRDYLQMLADERDVIKAPRTTDWSVLDIDGIKVENHSKRAGLQLADCVTSAFFQALEPNRYGLVEAAYATTLAPRLIRAGGTPFNLGLTVVPSLNKARCTPEQLEFLNACWLRKKGG